MNSDQKAVMKKIHKAVEQSFALGEARTIEDIVRSEIESAGAELAEFDYHVESNTINVKVRTPVEVVEVTITKALP